jgi:hypothetical protein
MTTSTCIRLLKVVNRIALPSSLLLRRCTHRCLALKVRAMKNTVSLLVALDIESLLDMTLTLL